MTKQEFVEQAKAMLKDDQYITEVVAVEKGTIAVVDDFVCDMGDEFRQECRIAPMNTEFWEFVGGWKGFYKYTTRKTLDTAIVTADDLGYEIVAIDEYKDGKLWIQVDYRDDDKDYIVEMTKLTIARNGSLNSEETAVEIDDNGCEHIAEDIAELVKEITTHKILQIYGFVEGYLAGTQPELSEALREYTTKL